VSGKTLIRKLAEERLLAEAVRDWRSGRAHLGKGGHYKLREDVGTRAKPAPWSKAVKKLLGTEQDPTGVDALHRLGQETYGDREAPSEFERMHGLDRVRTRLRQEIAEGKPAMPPGTRSGT
jgi:hypothetical protein